MPSTHRARPRRVVASLTVAVALAAGAAGCTGDDEPRNDLTSDGTTSPETTEPDATTTPEPSASDPSSSPPGQTPSGVVTGELADGFPVDVVPVLPGSTITVSTVSSSNGSRTLSLSGTTPSTAEEVLAFYRTALVAQGFVEAAAGPVSTFSRSNGADLVVVAVTTIDGAQAFTVSGTLAG